MQPLFQRTPAPAVPDMERIVDQYGTSLLRLCYLYLKDIHLAEDAVQETFLKVYRSYGQFAGGSGEKTWITRIAINVCKDQLRSAWKRRVSVVEELNDLPDAEGPHAVEDEALLQEVLALKPKYREVILLYYYQDLKISEIAQALQAPESTISVRLKRAREQLKKRLEGWECD